MISVYLGNEEIYAVAAEVKGNRIIVNNIYRKRISEGSIINGVITNEDSLKYDIEQFWEENKLPRKDVDIVINSKQLTMKNVTLPLVSDKKALNLISMEFADVEKAKPVFDYMTIMTDNKKKKMSALAVITEKDFIEGYNRIFSGLKIKIRGISSGIINIVKLYYNIKNKVKDETVLLQFLDGNSLVSIILSEGEYMYSQSTRIFSEKDSPDFVNEIVNTVSSIKQFYISTNKVDINKVYFGGIDNGTLEKIKVSLTVYNTDAGFVPESEDINMNGQGSLSEFAYGIGSYVKVKKDINLFKRCIDNGEEKSVSFMPSVPMLLSVGAVFGVIAVMSVGMLIRNSVLNNRLNEAYAFLNNTKNQEMVAKASSVVNENNTVISDIEALKKAKAAIRTYPVYNTKVRNIILSCQDSVTSLKIIRFDSENGSVRIEATCTVSNYVHALIDRLKSTGLFSAVDYNGYAYDEKNNVYKYNVDCTFVESAGQ